MTLDDFHESVDPIIFKRGKLYYEKYEAIAFVEWAGKHEVMASIAGTEMYSVFIQLDKKENILEHTCDCPYDWGPMCKHVVAVLLHLRDHEPETPEKGRTIGSIQEMEAELGAYSGAELRKLILDMSKRDAAFREKILWTLGIIG